MEGNKNVPLMQYNNSLSENFVCTLSKESEKEKKYKAMHFQQKHTWEPHKKAKTHPLRLYIIQGVEY